MQAVLAAALEERETSQWDSRQCEQTGRGYHQAAYSQGFAAAEWDATTQWSAAMRPSACTVTLCTAPRAVAVLAQCVIQTQTPRGHKTCYLAVISVLTPRHPHLIPRHLHSRTRWWDTQGAAHIAHGWNQRLASGFPGDGTRGWRPLECPSTHRSPLDYFISWRGWRGYQFLLDRRVLVHRLR